MTVNRTRIPTRAPRASTGAVSQKVGKSFEDAVKNVNLTYLQHGKATVAKVDAPVTTLRHRSGEDKGKIKDAFRTEKTILDFVGCTPSGRYMNFDTKYCADKEVFKLSEIKKHQMDQLETVRKMNGISFILVYFASHGTCYLLTLELIERFRKEREGTRASKINVPGEWLRENCERVQSTNVPFDYLAALERAGVIL